MFFIPVYRVMGSNVLREQIQRNTARINSLRDETLKCSIPPKKSQGIAANRLLSETSMIPFLPTLLPDAETPLILQQSTVYHNNKQINRFQHNFRIDNGAEIVSKILASRIWWKNCN